jgi:hypothetical protein
MVELQGLNVLSVVKIVISRIAFSVISLAILMLILFGT